MGWKQTRSFNPNKMGKRAGWCLQNCRLGFGIANGKYASAKADMEAQRKAGTLHSINTLPNNLAVPVYVDSPSRYEHIVVYDRGTWYSDGKKVSGWRATGSACFGWGELCDGTRVVSWVNSQTVVPTKGFLPSKGYWCRYNIDARVGKLADFMYKNFSLYTPKAALGNKYGDNLWRAIKEFQRRSKLVQDGNTGPKTYNELKKHGFKG